MASFFREVLSDDGVGSFGRTGSMISLLAAIGWVTFLVIKTHMIPSLEGPIAFLSAPYLITKASSTITGLKTPPQAPTQP